MQFATRPVRISAGPRPRTVFASLFVLLLASRLCHVGVLWEPGALPLAAGVQMLDGKALYRDIWYDKPPLAAAAPVLWGARAGWPLAVAGSLCALLACFLIYRFARAWWDESAGLAAAGLLGFFLIFDFPVAVIGLGPDLLMLAPHVAAVFLAWKRKPLLSGAAAGLAFLLNSKAVFVLAACAIWQVRALPQLALGFLLPNAAAMGWLAARGALGDYYAQVWRQGFLYARSTFLAHPVWEGLLRTVNWAGFHAAIVLGAGWYWLREGDPGRRQLALWAAISLAAVAGGWRFFPRYYLQLLPVLALGAARGLTLAGARRVQIVAAVALLVPLVRFGPRYAALASDVLAGRDSAWADVAMDRDDRAVARLLLAEAQPGDTLFVWGYRPGIYVYSRLPAASRFLESQPLTGVFADRHLTWSAPADAAWAEKNRQELLRAQPTFLVDGLGPYNPGLAPCAFPDLAPWLARYRLVGRTPGALVYRLLSRPAR